MPLREWAPNTEYKQGDCVVIPDGAGGYMGDANGAKTWLLCCVGSGATPDATPFGVSGAPKTQAQWSALFEDPTDGIISEATVLPATVTGTRGPDGTVRWGMGIAYFLDTSNVSSAGTGTFLAPYTSATQLTNNQISSSDGTNSTRHLYIKRGTTVALGVNGAQWLGRGSSRKMRAALTDYGPRELPRPKLDCSAAAAQNGVLISKSGANAARWCEVSGLEIFGAGEHGIHVFIGTSDPSLAITDIYILDNFVHNNKQSGIQALCGGEVDRSSSSQRITIQGNICTGNALFGIAVREWWDGAGISGNVVSGNGSSAPSGAYGITCISNFKAWTGSGWTNTSGTLWERNVVTRANPVIAGRWRAPSGVERRMVVDAARSADYTITNTGSTIQIRLGAGDNPNTAGAVVYACYNRIKNVDVIDNDVRGTRETRALASRFDGEGIGIDQFSANVRVLRNFIVDNEGGGILSNQPENLLVRGNIICRNGVAKQQAALPVGGVFLNHPEGVVEVLNNTIEDSFGDGVRVYAPNPVSAVPVRGNIIARSIGVALFGTLGSTVMASDFNILRGNSSNTSNVTLGGNDSTTASVTLDARFCPVDSVTRAFVPYPAGLDFYRKRFGSPASAGAVQYNPPRSVGALTANIKPAVAG